MVKLRRIGDGAALLGKHRPNCPDNAALRLALYRENKLAHHSPLRKRSCFALASPAQMSPPHRAMDCSTRRNVDLESTRNSLIDVSLIVPHDWILRKTLPCRTDYALRASRFPQDHRHLGALHRLRSEERRVGNKC